MNVILPLICSLISAGITIGGKIFTTSLHPFTFAFLRYGLTAVCLLPLVLIYREKNTLELRFIPLFIFLGFILVLVFNALYFSALCFSSATCITLIGATNPVLTLLASAVILRTLPNRYQLAACMLSFIGVALVITKGVIDFETFSGSKGEVYMLLAVMCQILYATTLKNISTHFSPLFLAFAPLLCGTLMILPFTVNVEIMHVLSNFNYYEWGILSFICIGSALDIVCYSASIKYTGPAWTNLIVFSTMPVFVFILEYLLLGKSLSVYQFLGGFLIVLSLLLGVSR